MVVVVVVVVVDCPEGSAATAAAAAAAADSGAGAGAARRVEGGGIYLFCSNVILGTAPVENTKVNDGDTTGIP